MRKKFFRLLTVCCLGLALLLSGCAEKRTPGGTLTVAVPEETLRWQGLEMWSVSGTSADMAELVSGMSPVSVDLTGRYDTNDAVVQQLSAEPLADGSKTFTVTLQTGLTFSDGTPLTARNYVAAILVFASPQAAALGATASPWCCYSGYSEYLEGSAFSGVSFEDDLTFSVTVAPSYIPVSEELIYLDFCPIDTALWLPADASVCAGEEGAFLALNEALPGLSECISAALTAQVQQRSDGPYRVTASDETGITLSRNASYTGTEAEAVPVIDTLRFVYTADPLAAVRAGTADICLNVQTDGETLNAIATDTGLATALRGSTTFTDLLFSCDTAPTDSAAVRQAVACLCDTDSYVKEIGGTGASCPDFITVEGLWYREDTTEQRETGLSAAAALLDADGWTLDKNGSTRGVGLRYKRVKEAREGDIVLENGTVLRPLRLTAVMAEGSSAANLLGTLRSEALRAGIEITLEVCSQEELESRLYRDSSVSLSYAAATAHIYVTEVPLVSVSEFPERFTTDTQLLYTGCNPTYLQDETLYRLALKLAYANLSADDYTALFTRFRSCWFDLTPELPLARSVTRDVYRVKLRGYAPGDNCSFAQAILRAWIEE